MKPKTSDVLDPALPTLVELGGDLLDVTSVRRLTTLALPFAAISGYVLFSMLRLWPLAVISVMALSFISYGSTSHDLVHHTLRLPRRLNDFMLSLIELLCLRSGTAYRLSHLHHHQHLLSENDIEGSVAHGSLMGALNSGITMQFRLWVWAWSNHPSKRSALEIEAAGMGIMVAIAVWAIQWSIAPVVYVVLVVAGSWLFPLITVYIPHDPKGQTPLMRTRRFRGWFVRFVSFDHLYHLEHHLYPAVPHHHWKTLADRLDSHFEQIHLPSYGWFLPQLPQR
jgi:beta-carotene hydroxylase